MTQRLSRLSPKSQTAGRRTKKQRRAMLFESLEGRSLLATITGGTAIGGFEALNSASLLYQLSASSLVQGDGTPVAAWNNSGTAANNFTQATVAKQPTYVATSTLGNNLPGVSFDGTIAGWAGNPAVAPNADELVLSNSTAPATLFIVNSTTSTNGLDGIIGRDNGDFGIRRQSAGAWQHVGDTNDFSNPGALYVNGATGTNPAVGLNTSHVLTATRPSGNALAATSIGDYFQVGGNQPRSWGGQIGDVLAFNRTLSSLERSIIENAFAAKYNVTLAAGDIYLGDTAGSGNYDFGVFGIGGMNGNLAFGKAATQSSELGGYPASLAVDGNLGNFTHTNSNDALASLTIDLGANNNISDVLLYNRGGGCCPYRLRDVTVELWTTNPSLGGSAAFTSPLLNPGNVLNGPAAIPVPTLTAGNPTSARWVVVRRTATTGGSADDNNVLSLGEVVVNGSGPSAGLNSAGQAGFGLEATNAMSLGTTALAGYKLAANSLVATDLPTGVDKRWDRAWFVDKTGAVDAKLAFDFSDAGLGAIPASTLGYQLLYSSNNNFESANSSFSVITATPTIVGDTISFAVPDASLQDGYYTLGLLDQATVLQANSTTGGDGAADAWRVVRSGAGGVNLEFYQGLTLVRSTPYASITSINVVGSNDNDTFTVDQTGGVIAKPMNYTGNGQTSSPGDTLVISGGSATTVTHTFINNSDGSVNIDGTVINYTGLEPITDNMVVAARVFTFTGAAETITISNVGGADGITRIDSTLGEFVDFAVPTTSLTINTNGGDTTTINGFDPALNTPTISFADASGTTSSFNLGASNIIPNVTGLSLTGNVNFNLNGFSETIASLASTNATPVVTLTAAQTLTVGDASSTSYAGTIVSGGSLVKEGAGTLTLSNKNPYTGGTTVNAGVLSLTSTANNGQSTVGTGDLVINAAGTVIAQTGDNQLGHTNAANIPNVVINGGIFTASSPFGGGMWFEGITMTGGTVNGTTGLNPQNAANSFLTTLASAATATVSTSISNAKTSFVITVADGAAASDLTISIVISGGGGVQKEGLGTLSLTTFNTYTGGTIVNGGTTLLGVGGATGTIRGTLTVNTGATVDYTAANTFGFTAGVSVNVLNINGGTVGGADVGQHFWNNFALNMNAGTLRLGGTLNEFHNPIITVAAAATPSQILPVTAAAVFRMRDSTSPLFNVADGAAANDLVLSVPLTQNGGSNITKSGAGLMRYDAASSGFNTIFAAGGDLTIGGSGTHTIGNILPGASIADGARATGNGTFNIQDTAIINAGGLSINNQTATVGIVNQAGGTLNISGGARIGHWPGGVGTYNLSGGALNLTGTPSGVVNPAGVGEQNGVLYVGVEGTGVFAQTGGTFTGQGVVLDGRGDTVGVDTLTLNGGTMTLGASGIKAGSLDANTTYLINLGGGTLRASATWSSVLNAALTSAVGPAIFDTNTFDISMSGVLSGAGALIKNSAGVLTLSGANSFGGAVTVNGGTLAVGDIANSGSNSNLGAGTPITLNGGTLRFNAAATDSSNRPITLGASHGGIEVSNAAGNITYSGGVAGGTNFTKFGAGQLMFSPATVAVNNLYISGGILALAGSGTTTVTGTVLPGAAVADGAQATGSGTLNVQGSVVLNAGGFSINNQSSTIGTVNQSGTSDVNIAGGFRIGHWPGGTGAYNISGGTLDVTGNPVGVVNPAGVGEQNGVIYLGVDGTGTMTISGTGAVTATGIVFDGRGNTAGTDTLTINGGLLHLGNNTNATTIAGSGIFTGNSNANPSYQINLGGGGTLRSITPFSTPLAMNLTGTGANAINVDTNGVNLTFTGILSGLGGLAKSGAGNLLVTNTNTYADVTNVNGGTLQLQNGAAIFDTAGAVSVALGATLQLLNNETISSYVGAGDGVGSNDSLLALGGNTLTTTGSAAIANVTTTAGGGIIAGTSITDNDDDNNVTGPNVFLQAGTGIGTAANAIETAVSSIQLNNTTSGDINILNSNAGALLTVANLRPLGFGSQNLGGATTIVNSSPLTIAANVISAGAVVLTATDSAAVGDNLTVNPGVTIQSTGSTVTLNAGDIATVPATALLAAAGTVTINIDAGVADPGVGGSLVFDSDVDAPLAVFNGSADTNGDSFDVRPDQDVGDVLTPIQVFGFAPIAGAYPVGDRLIVDINGLGTPTLTLGPGARNGSFSFGALAASLTYNDIETVESDPPGATFHVVLDMRYSGYENGANDTILAQLNAAGDMLQLFVNAAPVFEGEDAAIQSLTIIGSNDNEALTVQETAGGLPRFAGAAPAVNNIGIGGSTSNGSHLGSSADLALETLLAAGTPWNAADVTFHFDAGAGNDSLTVNYTTPNSSGYFSDTIDAGNSGNVLAAPGAFPVLGAPTLLMSFANIEPLALNGAGGLLLTDATGTSATTSLTLTDAGPATQIAGNNGFATTSFTGYQSAVIVGGDGAETLDVVSVDAATLTSLTLLGGNTSDLFSLPGGDVSADTLRIQSLPASVAATLNGNAGSDLFQLFNGVDSVDNIAGNVTVDGNDGNVGGNTDTLTIVNTGSANADAAVIAAVNPGASQNYYVDGVTTAVSEDVVFRNIDVLNYTGTTFADSIDARLQNTTPTQHDLSTLNLSGWTGADQFLLFTSDQLGGTGLNNTPSATASGVANVNLYGDAFGNPNGLDGNDTFGATPAGISGTGATNVGLLVSDSTRMIRPSTSTSLAIDGGQPTGLAAPLGDVTGDVLNVDVSALPTATPVIVSTFSPGAVVAAGIQPLTWTQIEDINLVDQGRLTNVQIGDLFARSTPNADLIQLSRNPTALNPNQVRLRITSTIGNYGVSNKTILYGGGANDTLTQSNLTVPAEFYGEAGDDYLTGAMNNDWLVGGDGSDRINGSGGDNVIWGDNAPTSADPTPQNAATGGDDQLSGLGGSDVFYGSGGNDLVSAGGGNDYANGGAGNDALDGNDGDDRLYGGEGNDVISGYTGNDLLSGGDGEDRLYGAGGNDVILAGDGADFLDGGDGNDLLINGIVANESSSWTSVASTSTFSAATYTNGGDNDAALLILLNQWGASSNSSSIGAITHDGDNDDLLGGTGDDDFCWETIDVQPALTPADYNALGMGTDQRIPPL